MANVNIKFNGKEFLLSCDDGQEEHLEELSLNLNEKFNDLKILLEILGKINLCLLHQSRLWMNILKLKKLKNKRWN